jgi:formate hydrogenlyase subunit 4
MDVGTAFGGIGSSREMMIASLAEPAMLLVVFSVALIAGTTQLSTIAANFVSANVGLRVSLGLAMFAFVFVAIAENARIPIDNPATHLELTMVHEAMVLEYSGRHLVTYLGKIFALAVLLPIGETAVAKMRVFRYPIFLGGAFAAGALAAFLLFVSRGF